MYYYQYDAVLQDGLRQETITYLLKTSTAFKGKDVGDCLKFQEEYLCTVLKLDRVLIKKLTYLTEPMAVTKCKEMGIGMNQIPTVDFCETAPGLHT